MGVVNLRRKRGKTANRVLSCRVEDELAVWVERYAYEGEISESQTLVRALKTLRGKVEKGDKERVLSPAEMPQNWLRRLAEMVLYHLLVNSHYHRQSLVDRHGEGQVEADIAALESEVRVQVRKLLGAIDESAEG